VKNNHNTIWRLIAKSLGEKSGKDNSEADKIASIRIFMFLSVFITNLVIIFGVFRTHVIPRDYIQKVQCVPVSQVSY
jgi:hypothetical protein